ncbi:cupin domain-containing protein [Flectobacillus longus]|uniref:cupin domain-containing protein n=1 Tax=Flectobacillus longus TaxID=2984207 RepID=UPI0024B76D2F|nr:cupin domain-containing protein [Flectobacillus longus]MDI9877960.1 cupin domain-containing protein [Flectobacillus longus]
MSQFGKRFVHDEDLAWEIVGEGLRRKVMSYDNHVMMVKVAFEKGAIGSLHSHYHTQISYVESGAFEITIEGKTEVLKQGDTYYIPPHIVHGAVALEAGVLVDVFAPFREDFV